MSAAVNGPVDVFLAANAVWAYLNRETGRVKPVFEWRVESLDGRPVRSASGYAIEVNGAIGGSHAGAVVLPAIFFSDLPDLRSTLGRLKHSLFLALLSFTYPGPNWPGTSWSAAIVG